MWLTNAILCMLFMGAMALAMKKVTLYGIPYTWILMFTFLLGAVFFLIHSLSIRSALHLTSQSAMWILCIAVFSYAGNLFGLRSIASAPNPGYTMAIMGCSSIIVLLGSVAFFDAQLSLTSIAGVILCVAGVVLLAI